MPLQHIRVSNKAMEQKCTKDIDTVSTTQVKPVAPVTPVKETLHLTELPSMPAGQSDQTSVASEETENTATTVPPPAPTTLSISTSPLRTPRRSNNTSPVYTDMTGESINPALTQGWSANTAGNPQGDSAHPSTLTRSDSRDSVTSVVVDLCRICHCESEEGSPLISPCICSGSLKFVHQGCLQQWIKSADTKSCELCKFDFHMTTKIKPFRKWQRLEMATVERRKIMCSVTFHVIAITCVIWSLYVLIDRTTQEIQDGILEWPFWTKLIVVAIGFTGGLVFMYVQCKMYIQLCKRWRAFNRVIFIQSCPEIPRKAPAPVQKVDANPVCQETELL